MTDTKISLARNERLLAAPEDSGSAHDPVAEPEFALRDILGLLVRRKWIVLGLVTLSLALSGLRI